MKICALIICLLLTLTACGGGGGIGAPSVTSAPKPFFQTDDLVLSAQEFSIVVDDMKIELPQPNWVNQFAQGQSETVRYLAWKQGETMVVAGQSFGENIIPFVKFLGSTNSKKVSRNIGFEGQIEIINGTSHFSSPIALTLDMAWSVPRLRGNVGSLVDVSASMIEFGKLTGSVSYSSTVADLTGGLVGTGTDGVANAVVAGFAGQNFYGVLTADRNN